MVGPLAVGPRLCTQVAAGPAREWISIVGGNENTNSKHQGRCGTVRMRI